MGETRIAWTDYTANFWMGCEKISPGCAHCYADKLMVRMAANGVLKPGASVWGPGSSRQGTKTVWSNLRKWNREAADAGERGRVFVMSLGDFFEDHPDVAEIRRRAWDALRPLTWLDLQILTKRPENIEPNLPADWPWPNVWLGVSIENDRFTGRADILRRIPAAVHFISAEPLLGPLPSLDLTGIDWLIIGGESGPGFRPMDHAWARALRDRAVKAGVALFMKQSAAIRTEMGTFLEEEDGSRWIWKQYPGQLAPPAPASRVSFPNRIRVGLRGQWTR